MYSHVPIVPADCTNYGSNHLHKLWDKFEPGSGSLLTGPKLAYRGALTGEA